MSALYEVPVLADGESAPVTEKVQFEVGHGRPDLQLLHWVVEALDNGVGMGGTIYGIREAIVDHVNTRAHDEIMAQVKRE